MNSLDGIRCGCPCFQNNNEQTKQTNVSIALRATAVALGVILVIAGILIFCGNPGLSQFNTLVTVGVIAFQMGLLSIALGISIKCVKYDFPPPSHNVQDGITIRREREEKMNDAEGLNKFYEEHGITTDDEPVKTAPPETDTTTPQKTVFNKIVSDLIDEINKQIENSSPQDSRQERRYVHINPNRDIRFDYNLVETTGSGGKVLTSHDFLNAERYCNATFLGTAVEHLVELGLIYAYQNDGHGYFLQA